MKHTRLGTPPPTRIPREGGSTVDDRRHVQDQDHVAHGPATLSYMLPLPWMVRDHTVGPVDFELKTSWAKMSVATTD